MSKKEFHLVVASSIICSALIKVDASSEHEATLLGRKKMAKLKPEDWRIETGGHVQLPHVVEVVDVSDLDSPDTDIRNEVMGSTRFMSLRANVETGEGTVTVQPWFEEKSITMQNDLVDDWITELSDIAAAAGVPEGAELVG